MIKVIAFGAFDPLEEGHKDFLRQAKELGDHLTVVVAHDSAVRAHKQREPHLSEDERLDAVQTLPYVDHAMIGHKSADQYQLLGELSFDVVALGYNQQPSDEEVREALAAFGKQRVQVVRLKEFKPSLHS